MAKAIRIDDELYNEAQRTGAAECRTVPLQIMFWAKLGKLALENPDLPIDFIRDTLIARAQKSETFEFRNPGKFHDH